MKKFRELSEQYREEGRHKLIYPKNKAVVSPRPENDSAKAKLGEAVKDKFDIGEYDQEGDMAKSDLRSILANAKRVHDMLEDDDNLPEWCQNKITLAEDYISTVANYLTAEMNESVKPYVSSVSPKLGEKGSHDVMDKEGKVVKSFPHNKDGMKAAQSHLKKMKEDVEELDELSNELLHRYKEKAADDARAADAKGDFKRGDKRFSGIINATKKQFANRKIPTMAKEETEDTHWSKSGKEAVHRETGKKTYEYREYKKGEQTGRREYRDEKGKSMGEEVEQLEEKNVPTSPEKWAQAKAQAKAKFDIWPSAYASGWAAKKYKEMGGGWKSVNEEKKKDDLPFTPDKPKKKSVVVGKKPEGYSVARHLARQAMQKYMKKPVKEETMSKKTKIVKDAMKKSSDDDKFNAEPMISQSIIRNN